ncbi:heavy-metal-associated domain-containing protein [Mycolicibacterium sp. BiH015]|uniref:heavy-metal-associated domain-containing protein n=1 Tax=Mycolicibacterium sp. BiH015 TaxID=3018808 RepID=UPI0022DEDCE7|nr:heavy-metal-associated domain-containing protein [Mycolicibacterium sp. BiH015]MDA2894343.1 heavy-metal-associated domain-containing protein [Mycolicibacterium sp. BiH015]
MNAAGRLGIFTAGLAAAFTAAYVTAAAVVPDTATIAHLGGGTVATAEHAAPVAQSARVLSPKPDAPGLSLAESGYTLGPVRAPRTADAPGTLSFSITDAAGKPLLDYTTLHDKQLHLIVVRADGRHFAHVHPVLDTATGAWSTPWTWSAAGTYRVFADFVPAGADSANLTLTRTVEVAGEYVPVQPAATRTVDHVAGYTVTLKGPLTAGVSRELAVEITRDGQPVTTLQPYLGAFGHLVALRDGDLAYLHVHPEGDEPTAGREGGRVVPFAATAPTAGRYLLYLDFKVRDAVHTATFVVDADAGDANAPAPETSHRGGHAGGH